MTAINERVAVTLLEDLAGYRDSNRSAVDDADAVVQSLAGKPSHHLVLRDRTITRHANAVPKSVDKRLRQIVRNRDDRGHGYVELVRQLGNLACERLTPD